MKRSALRILAFLLIPGLIADPATAANFHSDISIHSQENPVIFDDQALMLASFAVMHPLIQYLSIRTVLAHAAQELHRPSSALLFSLGGLVALVVQSANSVTPEKPQNPAAKAEALAQWIWELNSRLWGTYGLKKGITQQEALAQINSIRVELGFSPLVPDSFVSESENQQLLQAIENLKVRYFRSRRKSEALLIPSIESINRSLDVQTAQAAKLLIQNKIAATCATLLGVRHTLTDQSDRLRKQLSSREKLKAPPNSPRNWLGENVTVPARTGRYVRVLENGRVGVLRRNIYIGVSVKGAAKKIAARKSGWAWSDTLAEAYRSVMVNSIKSEKESAMSIMPFLAELDLINLELDRRQAGTPPSELIKKLVADVIAWAEGLSPGNPAKVGERTRAAINLREALKALENGKEPDVARARSLINVAADLLAFRKKNVIQNILVGLKKGPGRELKILMEQRNETNDALAQVGQENPVSLQDQESWLTRLSDRLRDPAYRDVNDVPYVSGDRLSRLKDLIRADKDMVVHAVGQEWEALKLFREVWLGFHRVSGMMSNLSKKLGLTGRTDILGHVMNFGAEILTTPNLNQLTEGMAGYARKLNDHGRGNLAEILQSAILRLSIAESNEVEKRQGSALAVMDRVSKNVVHTRLSFREIRLIQNHIRATMSQLSALPVPALKNAVRAFIPEGRWPDNLVKTLLAQTQEARPHRSETENQIEEIRMDLSRAMGRSVASRMAQAKIQIPKPLRRFTRKQKEVEVRGSTVLGTLQNLADHYPGIRKFLFTVEGEFKADRVQVQLGSVAIMKNLNLPVIEGDVLRVDFRARAA